MNLFIDICNSYDYEQYFLFRMQNWLKDRELGNKVNKKTIYEHISVGPKFKYKSKIDYDYDDPNETGWTSSNLKWTPDGSSLATIMTDDVRGETKSQIITVLDPNTDAGQLVKANIDLKYLPKNNYFNFIELQGTKAILSGMEESPGSRNGCIGTVSLLNGKLEQVTRKGFIYSEPKLKASDNWIPITVVNEKNQCERAR